MKNVIKCFWDNEYIHVIALVFLVSFFLSIVVVIIALGCRAYKRIKK